jgi:uncharacterized protein YbjT (DUF2867 family)
MSTLLILGATGLVGQQVLQQALDDDRITYVFAPTRRPLGINHAKLDNPIVDYDVLPIHASWWRADIAICALGTTMKQARSEAAFYLVDHDYVVEAAGCARAAGTQRFVLNSSLGAKLDSGTFYLRVKAETERDIAKLGFASLTVVRPSFLDGGKRLEKRPGEQLAITVTKALGVLIPKRWRPISTAKVAAAMLNAGLLGRDGAWVIESEQLH